MKLQGNIISLRVCAPLNILPGTLFRSRSTIGFHQLCWEACIPVGLPEGEWGHTDQHKELQYDPTEERVDGTRECNLGLEEGRGGKSSHLQTLSRKIRVGGRHLGPAKPKAGSCPLGGALRCATLLIVRQSLRFSSWGKCWPSPFSERNA